MKLGRAWENEAAQQNASSKVCLRRKPPKIIKLCRLRSCGCIIMADFSTVSLMKTILSGLWAGDSGSVPALASALEQLKGLLSLTQICHLLRPHVMY